jgi:F-type H+-transporting ATPase subunit epsilon
VTGVQTVTIDLKILLPHAVLLEQAGVTRMVVETPQGSFGLLPQRLDCTAVLVPGILLYAAGQREAYVATDEGMMVKIGARVLVSVRNAIRGEDLAELRAAVEREFTHRDEQEQRVRSVLSKLESGLVRRLSELQRD